MAEGQPVWSQISKILYVNKQITFCKINKWDTLVWCNLNLKRTLSLLCIIITSQCWFSLASGMVVQWVRLWLHVSRFKEFKSSLSSLRVDFACSGPCLVCFHQVIQCPPAVQRNQQIRLIDVYKFLIVYEWACECACNKLAPHPECIAPNAQGLLV